MNYAVVTDKLTKIYSKHRAVDEVNMHIPQGSIYGFVGENGSGKTTIIRLLMGLASPSKGRYSLFDVDFKSSEIYKIRHNISAIVEAPSLVPTMTADENLKYACMYYGVKDKQIIKDALHKVGLEGTGKKKVKDFSLGMRQRLGIAVLLLNKPTLILLDEPMNGLDPTGIAELRDLIIDLNKQGITFLISSHILSELEKIATHYGFISHGRLIKEISTEDLYGECQKSVEIVYEDTAKVEESLKKHKIDNYKLYPNGVIRVFNDVKPLDLLEFLHKDGIEIEQIRTTHTNIEEYYLDLIGGGQNA